MKISKLKDKLSSHRNSNISIKSSGILDKINEVIEIPEKLEVDDRFMWNMNTIGVVSPDEICLLTTSTGVYSINRFAESLEIEYHMKTRDIPGGTILVEQVPEIPQSHIGNPIRLNINESRVSYNKYIDNKEPKYESWILKLSLSSDDLPFPVDLYMKEYGYMYIPDLIKDVSEEVIDDALSLLYRLDRTVKIEKEEELQDE